MSAIRILLPLLFKAGVARLNGPNNASSSSANKSVIASEDILWTCEVIRMGEIRNGANLLRSENGGSSTSQRQPARCLDVPGDNGRGNVQTADCDGGEDQLWALCKDGTVRNVRSNWCLTSSGADTIGNVATSGCTIPTPGTSQLWQQRDENVVVDYLSGIEQTRFQLHQVWGAEGQEICMDVSAPGVGNARTVQSAFCSGLAARPQYTYWYFNNRSGVIGTGRLVNQGTNRCLAQRGRRRYNVINLPCEAEETIQLWTLYESGELINAANHRCLEAETNAGTGNIRTVYGCRSYPDIRWKLTGLALDSFLIQNDQSQQCLGISRRRRRNGNAQTYNCIDTSDLRFRWESAGWETPVGAWDQIACSNSPPFTHAVTRSVTSSRTITETTTIEVGAEIQKGVIFSGAKVTTSVSQSLAYSWLTSETDTITTTFPCQAYDVDGSPIFGRDTCMYQWVQTMEWPQVDTLKWNPLIIKCTTSRSAPQCPALSECADPDCSTCVPE